MQNKPHPITPRRYGVQFGSSSAQVNLANPNPDTLGVYAGTEGGNNLTLVIVNKDPSSPVGLDLANVPTGTYFLRHFGGQAGVAKWQVSKPRVDADVTDGCVLAR